MRKSLHAVGNGNGTAAGQLRLDMLKMFNDTVDDAGNIRDSDEIVRWLFDGRLKDVNITEARIKNVVREEFRDEEFTLRFLQQLKHPAFSEISSAEEVLDLINDGSFTTIVDNILNLMFDGSTG